MRALAPLLLLPLLALVACDLNTGPGGGPRDDEGVRILDDGFPEAGPAPDAGDDAGPPRLDLDAGLPFDAGLAEYQGAPEPGVRCGPLLNACDPGAACCVGGDPFIAACSPSNDAVCPAGVNNNLSCDGPEDCATDGGVQACCLGGDVATGLRTTCQDPLVCAANQQALVCTNTSECPTGLTCCGLVGGLFLPVDLGVCTPICAGGI